MTVTAEEAGRALHVIGTKMQEVGILTAEGSAVLAEEGLRIKKLKKATVWTLAVDLGRPVSFERVQDKNGDEVAIQITAKQISIDQSHATLPPFTSLDIALQMSNNIGEPIGRWHIDRANSNQGGPLFHLQFGGHNANRRDLDFILKEPRWCHPPMDIALLCEVVAANFFEKTWDEKLRQDPAWCESIRIYQRLCYNAYLGHFADCIGRSYSTALNQMWNGTWN